jgi:hypothetical protein
MEMARATGKDLVVVDGLRSKAEADFFRAGSNEFHLIQICAPLEARLKWLELRGRPDDPGQTSKADEKIVTSCLERDQKTAAALELRECRELSWGMDEAMRAADMKLRNDGGQDEFTNCVKQLLRGLSSRTNCTDEK